MKLHFEDIKFSKEKDLVRGIFLKNFYFDLSKTELDKLGKWTLKQDDLEIEGNEVVIKRNFNTLLEQKLKELKSFQGNTRNQKISGAPEMQGISERDAIYVYSGLLPLQGSLYFGLIDRNTNIIEIRPITGCNLNCIFCSVDLCRRKRDFVVNVDYLIEGFEKLAKLKLKDVKEIEAHINAQGEPLLYAKLSELIKGIKEIKGVNVVSIDTNGSLLTEKKVDELVSAGLTRFNISMNAFSKETAEKIAGIQYPFENVKKICKYIAKKCDILLAPVWLNGINDQDIEKIIEFSLELKKLRPSQKVPFIGIQNFLEYEHGRKPVKEKTWGKFFDYLKGLEEKYKMKLKLEREDFGIVQSRSEKPFKKDDVVRVKVICNGMFNNEMLCLAKDRNKVISGCPKNLKDFFGDRVVSINKKQKEGKMIDVKITRDKYNVFYGSEL